MAPVLVPSTRTCAPSIGAPPSRSVTRPVIRFAVPCCVPCCWAIATPAEPTTIDATRSPRTRELLISPPGEGGRGRTGEAGETELRRTRRAEKTRGRGESAPARGGALARL